MKLLSEYPFFSGGLRIRLYEFPNKLRVLLLADPSAPVIAYQTWFKVGSRHEKPGKTGLAHLFEHLMFNETKNLKHGEFDRLIEKRGGQTNAATWVDWTYYQSDVPSSELELITSLEAERMAHLILKEPQLESEREVVMNERRFRVEDDVDGFLSEELFRLAFTTHPYHWPTIGWMNDIQAISVEDARDFYKTYYAPNQATLVLVGGFQEEQALSLIQKHYSHLPEQKIPQEILSIEPEQTEERSAIYQKPVLAERFLLGYKAPKFMDKDHLTLQMLSSLLFGSPSSRIYKELVCDQEIASSVSGYITPFQAPGLFEIQVALQRNHTATEADDVIEKHLHEMQETGPTKEEVDRVKARYQTGFYQSLRSTHGKAEALGDYETTGGNYQLLFSQMADMKHITPEDMKEVARKYLHRNKRTCVRAVPDSSAELSDSDF